jgi:hypothetical protein
VKHSFFLQYATHTRFAQPKRRLPFNTMPSPQTTTTVKQVLLLFDVNHSFFLQHAADTLIAQPTL